MIVYCKILRTTLRIAEQSYIKNSFCLNRHNGKKTWFIINGLLLRGKTVNETNFEINGIETDDN